ncbi:MULTISPECIES: amino acid ABC transporter permease [Paenibacillus]|uniref:amino acid ABC transporter permease n=1 Tax=Paenibacillus TaxID=44249 RepID=UPI0022B8AC7D|nr:amino acid ABC transporter permease [Paenibacillus caseinilyticus]MCZ8523202.1 amino acid ABC transporter permease [Paenibacillus caseinilyticus]
MDFAGAYTPENIRFLMQGLYVTLKVAFFATMFSFLIGTLVGVLQFSRMPVVSQVLAVLVEVVRNLPLLLIIFFTRFALPEVGFKAFQNAEYAAIVALTVFEAAMISEIVRSGLKSIDKGQMEAARSSGLTYVQAMWYILLPQALRRMVPPMVSQFISLLKDTSLATVIVLSELLHNMLIVAGNNANWVIPIFIMGALIYFIVNYTLSLLARRLEARQV